MFKFVISLWQIGVNEAMINVGINIFQMNEKQNKTREQFLRKKTDFL